MTGRDVKEAEYQLELKGGTTWGLVGDGLLAAARAAEEEEIVAGLGDKNAQIVRFVRSFPEGVRSHESSQAFRLDPRRGGKRPLPIEEFRPAESARAWPLHSG